MDDLLNGRCPFCVPDPEVNVVQFENDYWWAWPNTANPEKNTAQHFLIVPKRHVLDIRDLSQNEFGSMGVFIEDVLDGLEIDSCGILIRNGDATLSAGTIRHLHVHIMVPDGTGRVESPFFKGPESEAESNARAIVFEKLRTGVATVYRLTDAEKALVAGGRLL
ncbi:MAG: HIT domain-containing protein [Patescibacteria group bacterium]